MNLPVKIFCCWVTLFNLISNISFSQSKSNYSKDTIEINELIARSDRIRFLNPDSSLLIAEKAFNQASEIGYKKGMGEAQIVIGEINRISGNIPQALKNFFEVSKIADELNDSKMKSAIMTFTGLSYLYLNDYRTALSFLFRANDLNAQLGINNFIAFSLCNTAVAYRGLNKLDSAFYYQRKAWDIGKHIQMKAGISFILGEFGNLHTATGNYDSALYYYRLVQSTASDVLNEGRVYHNLAKLFKLMGREDSMVIYAKKALVNGQKSRQKLIMLDVTTILADHYMSKKNMDSAVVYLRQENMLMDSMFGSEQLRKVQLLAVEEEKRTQDLEKKQTEILNRNRVIALAAAIFIFLLLGIFLFYSNRRKQKTNLILQKQKEEIENNLQALKNTQNKLIQSEKMASLGELTAGIAHEIQNPLNFVNNFSEINNELLGELKDHLIKNNQGDLVAITENLIENEEKINHHGKRADSIVKNMLQHSRKSSGQKELVDINALAEEYLRLAYHGMRAKDKFFNAELKTDFDPSVGTINVVPQELGRVILNILNNAFQAVIERSRYEKETGYSPQVRIETKKAGKAVIIRISDNGNGIPAKNVDKIFQPFFTTKATGEGTGLGLSLSYDIITKSHGGEIKVESKEGEGSAFIISLPLS